MSEFVVTTAIKKMLRLNKRKRIIQGGTSAGKTFGVLPILIDKAIREPLLEISVVSESIPHLRRGALKDFLKIMMMTNRYRDIQFNKSTLKYTFANGSYIEFFSVDQPDKLRGARRNILYINECNNVPFEAYNQLAIRTSGDIWLDYNPTNEFWVHREVLKDEDAELIVLTYLDNEYLSKEEISNIEEYKIKGYIKSNLENYDVPENIKNNFYANKWRVYGKGQVAILDDIVFTGWKKISFSDYLKIPNSNEIYVCDWGKVDPFAISSMKVYDKNLYIHELNYKSENEIMNEMPNDFKQKFLDSNKNIVTYTLEKLGIPKNATIICDNARPNAIRDLRKNGWEYASATYNKDILTGVTALQGMNIYYTETSVNLETELTNFTHFKDRQGIIKDKFIDAYNHLLDGVRYGWEYYFRNRIL